MGVIFEWLDSVLAHADQVEGVGALSSKRTITIHYRGLALHKVPVTCLSDEVLTRIWCHLKGLAVSQKLIP